MSRTAFFDLASGISGDMALGALADAGRRLGVDVEGPVARAVTSLGWGCSVRFTGVDRGGLAALRAEVSHEDAVLSPADLRKAIEESDASDVAKARALDGLDLLVGAEGRVHGVDPHEVHLHELGSPDTAADLLGAAVALEALDVASVAAAPVPMPSGRQGPLPLPAPAVLELLAGVPVRGVEDPVELVTPTGAAVLLASGCRFGPLPAMTLEATGTGAGGRELDRPNVCRVLVGRPQLEDLRLETDVLLEANIDDLTPEALGHALERLMGAGAKDAWVTPIVMKKSRPAFLLSVLGAPEDESRLLDVLFRETSTLGTRRRLVEKWALPRETVTVEVMGAEVRVKVGRLGGDAVTVSPEHEDCRRLAESTGAPLRDVYAAAGAAARRLVAG